MLGMFFFFNSIRFFLKNKHNISQKKIQEYTRSTKLATTAKKKGKTQKAHKPSFGGHALKKKTYNRFDLITKVHPILTLQHIRDVIILNFNSHKPTPILLVSLSKYLTQMDPRPLWTSTCDSPSHI